LTCRLIHGALAGKRRLSTPARSYFVGTCWSHFSPDGQTVALGNADNTIRLVEAASGKELHTLTGHDNGASVLGFSPDGKTLASRGTGENNIRFYDVAKGSDLKQIAIQQENEPPDPLGRVRTGRLLTFGLVFSPDQGSPRRAADGRGAGGFGTAGQALSCQAVKVNGNMPEDVAG